MDVKEDDIKPWVELTFENRLAWGGCLRTYTHVFKFTLKQCGIARL